MSLPLPWIRYVLILIPAISTLYLTTMSSYTTYTLYVLLLFWIIQIRKQWLPIRFDFAAAIVELLYVAWIISQFQGVFFIALFSTLVSIYELNRSRNFSKMILMLMMLTILNYAIFHSLTDQWILPNSLFVIFAFLLHYVHTTTDRTEQVEMLNDELRQKHYELDAARTRVVEYAKEVQYISQVEERNRISHEIHDDLGHKLIRLKMMLEAIVQIMPDQPHKAMDMTEQVRDQLSASIETLRTTVRKLKPHEHESNQYSLSRLIDEFASQCDIKVHYQMSGIPFELYPSEEFVLYRNAQEAMTNAVRHGNATEVYIIMHYELKAIKFTIRNNGTLPAVVQKKGLGISGMEERAQLLGGDVTIDFKEQFTISTFLPHHGII